MGYNTSTVSSCYNTGSIIGVASVGGIVGYNSSTVNNCYNRGNLTASTTTQIATSKYGGIVGENSYGKVSYCYNTGNVKNDASGAGGIIGSSTYGEVSYCYNIGNVEGNNSNSEGGIVGSSVYSNMTISYCYYDSDKYTDNRVYGASCDDKVTVTSSEGKTGLYAQLMAFSLFSYLNTDYWKSDGNTINDGYPILSWQ